MRREFLLLAHDYDARKHHIPGWFVSEKIDGSRAWWDGGITRGMLAERVPWANVDKKVGRIYATGLWSRYGNVIHAPEWWTSQLPDFPLDGELTAGRGKFQYTRSVVSRLIGNEEWHSIDYMVFDLPHYSQVLTDGVVNLTNYKKRFDGFVDWFAQQVRGEQPGPFLEFETMLRWADKNLVGSTNLQLAKQIRLPFTTMHANQKLMEEFTNVIENGGEGVIIRKHVSMWEPKRSWNCLKLKPENDDEGIVTGYVWGRETDKGSKLLNLMGALVLDYKGRRFELSGFRNDERVMLPKYEDDGEGEKRAGKDALRWYNPNFPIGSLVSFKYRELSDIGLPKEARYYRIIK